VEQGKLKGIHIMHKTELKNVLAGLLQCAFLIKVYSLGNSDTFHMNGSPGEFHAMLKKFQ
jgi:hypothetical protein